MGLCAGLTRLWLRCRPVLLRCAALLCAALCAPQRTSTGFNPSLQPANPLNILKQPTDAGGWIYRRRTDVRHRPLGPVEPERVKTQPFEDDLLLLRQDGSSFEYWGWGGSDVPDGASPRTSELHPNRILKGSLGSARFQTKTSSRIWCSNRSGAAGL